jgi:ParB family chromosome partitioning protein
VTEIQVDRIRPNALQPRSGFSGEPLAELEASIREQGILQPVLVRRTDDGYELVAGERRWRAAVAAGLRSVPAIVRQLDDRGALEAALVENLQREDLNAIERARAYRRLGADFGLSQEQIARRVGRSQPSVANTLRLLGLPPEVQASLEAGRITEGHARALAGVSDAALAVALWKSVESKGLSVRETEALARKAAISRGIRVKRLGRESAELNIIRKSLESAMGSPVRVSVNRRGGGEIRITFFSPADLDRLLALLGAGEAEAR